MKLSTILGAAATSFLVYASMASAEAPSGIAQFKTAVTYPFTLLAAERVRGIRDVVIGDPFTPPPEVVARLERRASEIADITGVFVSADLLAAARRGGIDDALAQKMGIAELVEQAQVALSLPEYLEAQNETLNSWSEMLGLSPFESAQFSNLTICAGMQAFLLDDHGAASDLMSQAQAVITASEADRDKNMLLGYQAEIFANLQGLGKIEVFESAMLALGEPFEIFPDGPQTIDFAQADGP